MTSDFEDVFGRFRSLVEDYDLAAMEEDMAGELLADYLKAVVGDLYVARLFTKMVVDTDVGEIEYVLRDSWNDDSDKEYVEQMLAIGMLYQWCKKQYYTVKNSLQFFGQSETKFYSQANHMEQLHAMKDSSYTELRKFVRDRGYSLPLV